MDIDPLLKSMILDFLLRQSLDPTLISLIRALAPPDDNFSLMKLFLLKKLESDVSGNSVSEKTLELLETIMEAEFQLGNESASDALKRAFCAVAVECTVKYLKNGDRFGFLEAVEAIWKGKIEGMGGVVEGGNGGLGSEELWGWKEEIEKVVGEEGFGDIVVEKSGGVNGVECVNKYVREEREKMGPSFLELVAERLRNGVSLQEILGVGVDQGAGKGGGKVDKRKGKRKVRENGVASGNTSNGDHNGRRANGASEVDESGGGLGSVTEAVKSNERRRRTKAVKSSKRRHRRTKDENATRRPSSNARARERGESTYRSQEGRGSNFKIRRITRRWSPEEEEIFITELNNYGKGSWKTILDRNPDTFLYRTGVDLKDKYRNLKRPQTQPEPEPEPQPSAQPS